MVGCLSFISIESVSPFISPKLWGELKIYFKKSRSIISPLIISNPGKLEVSEQVESDGLGVDSLFYSASKLSFSPSSDGFKYESSSVNREEESLGGQLSTSGNKSSEEEEEEVER